MTAFTIAAAQTVAAAGDIVANVEQHLAFVEAAAHCRVQLLVFPELSLTGYELDLAAGLAIEPDDARLQPLREAAQRHAMTVVVGAPQRVGTGLKIAAFALRPDGGVSVYCKQYLHSGEEAYFTPGVGGLALPLGGTCAALAICADILHGEHAAQAAGLGAKAYAAGVLISERGYGAESALLRGYAETHRMAVLLANHGGPSGGWQPAGKSALWDEQGRLVAAAEGTGAVLVVGWHDAGGWRGEALAR